MNIVPREGSVDVVLVNKEEHKAIEKKKKIRRRQTFEVVQTQTECGKHILHAHL